MPARKAFLTAAAVFLTLLSSATAQVPQLINFQGRIAVGNVNFDGTGQFKFALVNGDGTTTYWSNDGTSAAGSEPAAAVSLQVSKGLYSVLLGDAALPNMTVVPATVFANADVRLRVWFDDGAHGVQQLAPDQRIAAVGYAMVAANVADGAITSGKIAAGAVGPAQLAEGAAAANLNASGSGTVASGGVILSATENPALVAAGYIHLPVTLATSDWQRLSFTGAPSPIYGGSAIWSGAELFVWGSGTPPNGRRYDPTQDAWAPIPAEGAPELTAYHSTVWTGTEMIVWGGLRFGSFYRSPTGARYNPASNTWVPLPDLMVGRIGHTAIWTGTEMIIWGGTTNNQFDPYVRVGARYSPSTDTWNFIDPPPETGELPPRSRQDHVAVWTGSEMIIWGGSNHQTGGGALGSGWRYNPNNDSWSVMSEEGAPGPRTGHSAVWTGTEMIVWGGDPIDGAGQSGARYNPATDTWAPISAAGAPSARAQHRAVWTGSEMIIWAGMSAIESVNTGGRYHPATDKWVAMPTLNAPFGGPDSRAVWIGNKMLVLSGENGSTESTGLYSYTPGGILHLYQRP